MNEGCKPWIKTRESLNDSYKMLDPQNGDETWHIMHENELNFMTLNDISLGSFAPGRAGYPRNLHLWAQRPTSWLPEGKFRPLFYGYRSH